MPHVAKCGWRSKLSAGAKRLGGVVGWSSRAGIDPWRQDVLCVKRWRGELVELYGGSATRFAPAFVRLGARQFSMQRWTRNTQLTPVEPVRQRCQVACSTLATAVFSPSCAAKIASLTPYRRARRSARSCWRCRAHSFDPGRPFTGLACYRLPVLSHQPLSSASWNCLSWAASSGSLGNCICGSPPDGHRA
jgi:hypothetical protein